MANIHTAMENLYDATHVRTLRGARPRAALGQTVNPSTDRLHEERPMRIDQDLCVVLR
ncbi:MAG: hypothetical protein MZV65_44760 [Chromatiales bacterium]|nr:hypothetical protein [Chromatiales bacterium]